MRTCGWLAIGCLRVGWVVGQLIEDIVAVAHGGEASTATNGFWSALNMVTTERLPFLFFIEDNGYGISVPSRQQTPGGNIARNLEGFRGLAQPVDQVEALLATKTTTPTGASA